MNSSLSTMPLLRQTHWDSDSQDQVRVQRDSLRTLIAVSKVRASNKDWKDLATTC
jgi:hypothetical protein